MAKVVNWYLHLKGSRKMQTIVDSQKQTPAKIKGHTVMK